MGGILILLSVTVSTLLWADLTNKYIWLVLGVMLSFGFIGWLDDYKKITENGIVLEESVFKNNEYDGLAIFRNDSGIVVSKGVFSKGLKIGIWEVFENGKLVKKSSADLSLKSKSPQQK